MSRKATLWLAATVLLISLLAAGVWIVRRTVGGVENAYAVWHVADWVIDHMEAHNGEWPRGWDDLEAVYRARAERDVREAIAHYREQVEVDFDADPKQLARAPFEPGQKEPPFRVIRHRRGPEWVYEGREPNEMIWYYLNRP